MKPQVNHKKPAVFPVTDYNYQPAVDAPYTAIQEKHGVRSLRGFWKLGTKFHAAEAIYGDAADFALFTLMGLICTWPFFSVGMAIVHVFCG